MSDSNELVFKATIEVYYRPKPEFTEEFRGYEGPEQAEFLTYMKDELQGAVSETFSTLDDYHIDVNIQEVPEWPK
ncbi:hypothetical protein [Bacillus sp. 7894-2]|uniref:hypothetical protein n=1 Tax=Bacillus sp. 7894-2 TaxID=2021695 RepID=UPI000BA62BBB|nr:hypothetical protein [Bacillus sp. 7894-2]PAE24044.1 hypothetical protein CHI10_14665 [Bacillus sp. 7894-2]